MATSNLTLYGNISHRNSNGATEMVERLNVAITDAAIMKSTKAAA